MVSRRIQLTGGSTYIVSLPSKWIKKNNLGKGDEVFIDEQGNSITIYTKTSKKDEKIKKLIINGIPKDEDIQRYLISGYIAGYDSMVISSPFYINEKVRNSIKNFAKLVIGIEIFEEDSNRIVLQNVVKSDSMPLNRAIKRMSLNVESMIGDVIKGITDDDENLLNNVIARDDEIDRFQWYIYRESRISMDDNNIFYLLLSRIMERIADHAVNLCSIWINRKRNIEIPKAKIVENLKEAFNIFQEAISMFYSNEYKSINSIISKKQEIYNSRKDLLFLSSTQDIMTVSLSAEEISRIGLYATDIAELSLDSVFSSRDEISI
ncbi:phosphate signaling complex PhoU family protein [Picrophilus oshimae]|uniref:Phosphate uptake regulator n=1 Tax=Picrophilus torridus (strain ATCC 700027 / DSM 9790 / JCM 10055 / NBRC 100828 / KAW 2/3) TaxID=1122961 RepID=Q6L1K1_PICTO|nr:phosphate uptake regulator PhoU [Picrophilus oshimae]AAT43151.1 phosphate uptake regulator [Picrophilus oshimae DSM 9789]